MDYAGVAVTEEARVVEDRTRALLLTDRQSAYITGTGLPVDGGWTSH
jgi:NAD(P)-dependent dehydrogenase (short-subunit alcohol dehydrogenase family)